MKSPLETCRNCGGKEFYTKDVSATGGHGPNLLPIGFFTFPQFHLRVCGNCGLVDWFVPQDLLPKVKKKFTRES